MKSALRQAKKNFWLVTTVGFVVMIVVSQAQKTCAQQWTNNSNNIYYNSGTVGIGTNTPSVLLDLVSSDSSISTIQHSFYGDSGNARFNFRKARGTFASPTAAANADRIFALNAWAHDGSTFITTSQVVGEVDGTVSAGIVPGRLMFITKNTSGALLERMRIDSNGNVGIGTSAPASRLHVWGDNSAPSGFLAITGIGGAQTVANTGGYIGLSISPYYNSTGTLNALYGNMLQPYNYGSGTVSGIYGSYAAPLNLGNGTVNSLYGVFKNPSNNSSGTVGNMFGDYTILSNWGSSPVTNAYGLFVDNPLASASGLFTNNYGLYIANQTAATNNYAIYSAGGRSYFAGYVGIGNGSPAYPLDVSGQIHATGGFRFNDNTVQTTAATVTSMTAGAGLTGSTSNGIANVDIGQGTGVTVAADSISVNYGSGAGTAVEGNKLITITTDGSSGLMGGAAVMLGSGPSFTLVNTDKGSTQPIFKNVTSGTTQFSANLNNDSVRFEGTGGANVSLDVNAKKVIIDASGITSSQWANGTGNINYASGKVGIGTTDPSEKLEINGNLKLTGTGNITATGIVEAFNVKIKYQDLAEWVPSSERILAGTVVVLDTTKTNQVISSTQAYDTRVAGVVSEQPGIALGEGGQGKVLVATTGRVLVKADATNGPIHIGDLLVTSDIPGLAMKSEPIMIGNRKIHTPGTLIGKALEPLEKGSGKILVLLSLQ